MWIQHPEIGLTVAASASEWIAGIAAKIHSLALAATSEDFFPF